MNRENLNISRFPQKYYSAQVFSTFIIIINDSWASNQHIRIIFEGSCDTEDWINDAENTALHHRNKLHFKIYSNRKTVIIFHNITDFKWWILLFLCFSELLIMHRTRLKIFMNKNIPLCVLKATAHIFHKTAEIFLYICFDSMRFFFKTLDFKLFSYYYTS